MIPLRVACKPCKPYPHLVASWSSDSWLSTGRPQYHSSKPHQEVDCQRSNAQALSVAFVSGLLDKCKECLDTESSDLKKISTSCLVAVDAGEYRGARRRRAAQGSSGKCQKHIPLTILASNSSASICFRGWQNTNIDVKVILGVSEYEV